MSQSESKQTIVIGAGQAGLALSRCLQTRQLSHAVLERECVGASWRNLRWDSFHLNTPNCVSMLPGKTYDGDEPLGFFSRDTVVSMFEDYRKSYSLPVEEGVEVHSVKPSDGGFEIATSTGVRTARNVVLCCGDQNTPRTPELAGRLPDDIVQMHAADYRRPGALPDGAVLVVGSGQTGGQIAEDLSEAGRTVYLCTSSVGRVPRRYRGKDIFEWMLMLGMGDQRAEDLENPAEQFAAQPLVSGTRGGHTLSLPQLARDGVHLLGRLGGIEARVLHIDGDLEANLAAGDALSARIRGGIDMVIANKGLDAPLAEPDPCEAPFDGIADMAAVRTLDLDSANIRSVVWATGFGGRYDFLDPSLLDDRGKPRHTGGVCEVPGLYCVGFTWQRRRLSGLLPGVGGDAEAIAELIASRAT